MEGPYVCHLAWTMDVGAGNFYSIIWRVGRLAICKRCGSQPRWKEHSGFSLTPLLRQVQGHKALAKQSKLGVTVILDNGTTKDKVSGRESPTRPKVRLAAAASPTARRSQTPKSTDNSKSAWNTECTPAKPLSRDHEVPTHPIFATLVPYDPNLSTFSRYGRCQSCLLGTPYFFCTLDPEFPARDPRSRPFDRHPCCCLLAPGAS